MFRAGEIFEAFSSTILRTNLRQQNQVKNSMGEDEILFFWFRNPAFSNQLRLVVYHIIYTVLYESHMVEIAGCLNY